MSWKHRSFTDKVGAVCEWERVAQPASTLPSGEPLLNTTYFSVVHICLVSTNFVEKEEVLRSAENKIKK